jgi:hypothetical protein
MGGNSGVGIGKVEGGMEVVTVVVGAITGVHGR